MIKQKLLDNLVCPNCLKSLNLIKGKLVCYNCQKKYLIINDCPYLLEKQGDSFKKSSNDAIINKLKVLFKKYPKFFSLLYYTLGGSFVGKSAKKAIENIGSDKLIINLGSGIKRINNKVVNIDFYPFTNVDIVADITKIPLKDNSVDAIICESVLEHIKNPWVVIQEIKRTLKLDGIVYLSVPFIIGFHSSPDDYYRWSKQGLRELLKDFKEEEIGIRHGPTSAMLYITNEWMATLLSFGFQKLHQFLFIFFTIITSPIKIFDYLIYRFKSSENIAYEFYFIGKKK